jgi:hypothetical protein
MLAIIGGDPRRFRPYVDLYHRAFEQLGKPVQPIGVHSPGYVAETDEQAREELWPDYKRMRDRIGAERGWPPMGRAEFDREADQGSLYVGAPETVARKIAATVKALGVARWRTRSCCVASSSTPARSAPWCGICWRDICRAVPNGGVEPYGRRHDHTLFLS